MISEQDKQLADRMIVLENLITTLDNDKLLVQRCNFKIPEVYDHFFDHLIELVRKDMVSLRAVLKKEQIKIISIQEDNGFTQYEYLCKGYQSVFRYWSYAMDMKVLNAFYEYVPLKNRK